MSAILTAIGAANQYYNPGTTWTYTSSGLTFGPTSVAYSGSVWCAVGSNSSCATSSNGTTWTANNGIFNALGGYIDLYSVVWNGTIFCATSANARIFTSSDGVNWTYRTGLISVWGIGTSAYTQLVWTGTYFVALTSNGRAARSTDGITWTNITTLSATSWGTGAAYGLLWNKSNLYALGLGSSGWGTAVSSDQGATWAYSSNINSIFSYSSEVPTKNSSSGGIVYSNGKYIVTAYATDFSQSYVLVATSTDGLTWSNKSFATSTLSGWGTNTIVTTMVTDNKKVLVFGSNYSSASGRCAASWDGGSTWINNTYYTSAAPGFSQSTTAVYANNSFCVAFGGFMFSYARG